MIESVVLFERGDVVKVISVLVVSLFLLTGCSESVKFQVTEVSTFQEVDNQYMKIVFTSENTSSDAELRAIKVGGVEIKEAYLINDNDRNSPEEWERNKVSNLPVKLTDGEAYAVLLISEDPQFLEQERLLFDYSEGEQVISVESDFLSYSH